MKPRITKNKARGNLGERVAARYLRRRFYRILERNWYYYHKEVDIIARRGDMLVICEVKTRSQDESSPYGPASRAVDAAKQKNLLVAARGYARRIGWQKSIRMDVIEVYLSQKAEEKRPAVKRIVHIKNAFTA